MSIAIEEDEPRHRAKKDTRRWCKGKVGVKHDYPEPTPRYRVFSYQMNESRCTQCGKKLIEMETVDVRLRTSI